MEYSIKIGNNKGKSRLWIEGKKLLDFGFLPDTTYNIEYVPHGLKSSRIYLVKTPDGTKKVSRRKKDNCPIIDLSTVELTNFLVDHFSFYKRVNVSINNESITFSKEVI